MTALGGALIPMACTNTSSNFNPTSPATPVVPSATPTNPFGFTNTPTFTIQPTETSTNTPVVTPITAAPICTPNVPNGIAVNSAGTTLYVAGGDGTLSIYPIAGGSAVTTYNQFNDITFSVLSGVAVDSTGNLYVLDSGASASSVGTIYEFDSSNNPVTSWNNYNGVTFINPQGIAVDSGNRVYIVDTGNDVVDEFTPNGASTIQQIGYAGAGNGDFNSPSGIAVGTASTVTIYVADMDNERIQEFSTTGAYLGQFATLSESFDPGILGIAVNGNGNVFAADYGNGFIEDFHSTSSPVTLNPQWGGPSSETNPFGPTGVALNSAGTTLYVSDYDNNYIYAVTTP